MLCLPVERLLDKEKIYRFFPQEEQKGKSQYFFYSFTVRHSNVGNFVVFSDVHMFLAYFYYMFLQ